MIGKVKVELGQDRHEPKRRSHRTRAAESLGSALSSVESELRLRPDQTTASVEFGIRLRRARIAQGMTQTGLAERTGIPQAMISSLEKGKGADGPTYSTIRKLAEVLELNFAFSAPDEAKGSKSDKDKDTDPDPGIEMINAAEAHAHSSKIKVTELPPDSFDLIRDLVADDLKKLVSDHPRRWRTFSRSKLDDANVCMWLLGAHVGARFRPDVSTVYYIQNKDFVTLRVPHHGRPAGIRRTGHVMWIDASSEIDLANTSSEKLVVFSVPANALLEEKTSAIRP